MITVKNKFGKEEKIDRFLAWTRKLKMGKEVSKTMRVCSLHFSDGQFINKGM